MQLTKKEQGTFELKKHIAAVHSSNHLTLVQRKIANALLYNAYHELLEKDEHQIHISSLCKLIGYESKDHKTIKNALKALISTVIEWNLVDKQKDEDTSIWNASAIIADASIDGPVCSYSYGNKMKQLLHHPEFYARLNMQVLARFKSSYGIALYENCIRYQDIGQTAKFDIPTFRKLMGVEEKKYAQFRDFKRRVIDVAVDEVNQHSSISVSDNIVRWGREVVSIQFKITKQLATEMQQEFSNKDLEKKLQDLFGMSKTQVDSTLSKYEEKYIVEKISVVESSTSFQKGKITNLSKYLESALMGDFQQPTSKLNLQKSQAVRTRSIPDYNPELEDKRDEYSKYRREVYLRKFLELSDIDRSTTTKKFVKEYIANTIYEKLYDINGVENPLIKDRLCNFLATTQRQWQQDIISFERFCNREGC